MPTSLSRELFHINNFSFLERTMTEKVQILYLNDGVSEVKQLEDYLQNISRLHQQARRIITASGSVYIRTNQRLSHYIRLMLDQIYGTENFRNEIIITNKLLHQKDVWNSSFDILLHYTKSNKYTNNPIYRALKEDELEKKYNLKDANGPFYYKTLTIPRSKESRPNLYFEWRGFLPSEESTWLFSMDSLNNLFQQGLIVIPQSGLPKLKVYLSEDKRTVRIGNLWDDLDYRNPYLLFERMISKSSNEGDQVLDPYCLNSNFLVAAELKNRSWIGCCAEENQVKEIIKGLAEKCDILLDRDFSVYDEEYIKNHYKFEMSSYKSLTSGLEFERTMDIRMRIVSIDEDSLLTCLKHKLWGSSTANIKNWHTADYIVFIVNKHLTALAKVTGEIFKSEQTLWRDALYPYRLPIDFQIMLADKDRIRIEGEVKEVLKGHWGNYGVPIRNKLLLPINSASYIINTFMSSKSSLYEYEKNINDLLNKAARIHREKHIDEELREMEKSRASSLTFRTLQLKNWRQFEHIDLVFHERLTIITGANGTGKTTILNILNNHFGWENNLVSAPRRGVRQERMFYSENRSTEQLNSRNHLERIGMISYSDGTQNSIIIPSIVADTYRIQMEKPLPINGLHIPSHRPIYAFDKVDSIPTEIRPLREIFEDYSNAVKNNFMQIVSERRPIRILKESLISMAMFGYGNEVIHPNIISLELFKRFERILSMVLPLNLGFEGISIQIPDVILNTKSGDFSLDAVSGGIASIIDLAWQIFLGYSLNGSFIMTIDEPENHLHPEMQRSLLPNLLRAFPHVQFVVVTHNSFIVSSVPESNIYVLNYDHKNKIISSSLDFVNKAGTANEILRDALGLSVTMPIWVETQLQEITQKYQNQELNHEMLQALRKELENIGLERYVPDTMVRIIEGEKND